MIRLKGLTNHNLITKIDRLIDDSVHVSIYNGLIIEEDIFYAVFKFRYKYIFDVPSLEDNVWYYEKKL